MNKIKTLVIAISLAAAASAQAAPARPGATYTVTQPDGTTITLRVAGDERTPHYLTADGHVVLASEGCFRYAMVDADGSISLSRMPAHDPELRSADEAKALETIDREAVVKILRARNAAPRSRDNTHDGIGLFDYAAFPTKGSPRSIAILVEYADVKFSTDGVYEYFNNLLNKPNFTGTPNSGSCLDYFTDNSMGQFTPQFDLYGPITLPNTMAYYGGNDVYGNDKRPHYMMLHAAQALDDEVDFSQYDSDGDGYVDNIYIFYAGEGEAGGGGDNSVWPHNWLYSFGQLFDGVRIQRYACSPELQAPGMLDGLGTFAHEFGHVLGLPDLYNTENANVTYTPCDWSVMDVGCYGNDSYTPVGMSSYERNALGWMGENLVEITGPADCTLESLIDTNKAYVISTPKPNEFFLFENRQKTGWDKTLPGHGMIVWHIDYNKNKWENNEVNNNKNHQYVDLVEACNTTYAQRSYMARYPFPGTRNITKFIYGGVPDFATWNGYNLELDITDIAENKGVITFKVAGGAKEGGDDDDPAGIDDLVDDTDNAAARYYNMQGIEVTHPTPGQIYIKRTGTKVTKVKIK